MSSTRADIFNPLIVPLLVGAIFDGFFARVYLAVPNWKVVALIATLMHIHYGVGVVRGLANYLNIRVFKIIPIKTNWQIRSKEKTFMVFKIIFWIFVRFEIM